MDGGGKLGKGKSGPGPFYMAKRHKPIKDDYRLSKGTIRKLLRRAGVKRINGLVYDGCRNWAFNWLTKVCKDAVVYTEHARRKTITALDVVYALRRDGSILYGFDSHASGFVPMPKSKSKRLQDAERKKHSGPDEGGPDEGGSDEGGSDEGGPDEPPAKKQAERPIEKPAEKPID